MKTANIFYILIGCLLVTLSVEAYGKKASCCAEPSRARDGEHGAPGYFEDGKRGQDGEHGKGEQDGGHGGNGGSSNNGNGGNGGNGGDAD